MKRLIFILAIVGLGLAASAQTNPFTTGYLMPTVAHDTCKTGHLTVNKIFTVTSGYDCMGVQVVMTKISGTCNGNARFYGSIDGTNYQEITAADSLHMGDATAYKIWTPSITPFVYYKVTALGRTTTVAKVTVTYVLRKTQTHNP